MIGISLWAALAFVQAAGDPKEKGLQFTVEAAPDALLACRPLSVRFRLTNTGGSPLPVMEFLDLRNGDISAEAAPAGTQNFRKVYLGQGPERPVLLEKNARVLAPGASVSWQADVNPFLGYEVETNTVKAGTHTLRISMQMKKFREVQTRELTVTYASPTGDDERVLSRLLKENLLPFVGSESMRTCPQTWKGDAWTSLTALRAIIDDYPASAYSRDLRAGSIRLFSVIWVDQLKEKRPKDVLHAQAKALCDEYWNRDAPESWARATGLIPLARLSNFSGDPAREKAALSRFVELCPDDVRADEVRATLKRRER